MSFGMDMSDAREMILTLIMIGCGLFGAVVNYALLKWSRQDSVRTAGLLYAIVLGSASGFIFAYLTHGGTGIGHWDAAWAAFLQGLAYESVAGKLRGLYALHKDAKDAEEDEPDDEPEEEPEAPKPKTKLKVDIIENKPSDDKKDDAEDDRKGEE